MDYEIENKVAKINGTVKRFELKKIQTEFPEVQITSPKEGADFIRQFYGDDMEIYESFFILCLDRSNKTQGYAKISQGGVAGVVVDVKLIAKYAIENLSSGVILAHNHPSGNTRPSTQDLNLTKKIKSALMHLDVSVIDHIILTKESYHSFADNLEL